MSPRAYTTWIVAGCLALLTPVLALNLLLLANDHRHDKNRLASQWQQESGGVTYAPPINNNRAFKTLRLHDRLDGINALAFGSSTVMSLTADAFPAGIRAYNFAQSGNSLLSVLGEVDYVLTHWPDRIRVMLIPLDAADRPRRGAGAATRAAAADHRAARGAEPAAHHRTRHHPARYCACG